MNVRICASLWCCAAALCFFGGGCAKLPRQSITDATKALEAAKKSGAENYAPSQLKAAEVSYDLAMKEISQENRKLPFMRNIKIIIEMLDNATRAANGAQAAAEKTKLRIKSESQRLLDRSLALADSLDTLLVEAAKKEKNIDTIQGTLDSVKVAIRDAQATLNAGDLLYAKEKSVAVGGRIDSIVKSTDGLIPPPKKVPGKKKKRSLR